MAKISYRCRVVKTGAGADGSIAIHIISSDGSNAIPGTWFNPPEPARKEMLAVALVAITSNLEVDAVLDESLKENDPIYNLYLVAR